MTNEETMEILLKYKEESKEDYYVKRAEALDMAIKAVEKARWIPVSEKLPEEFADVLCSTDSKEVFVATYYGKMNNGTPYFIDNNDMIWEDDIIAWMPLPKPYMEVNADDR